MSFFVWSKMQTESGMTLSAILALKEVERLAGNGVFWWGVGNSLGPSLQKVALDSGGSLPVLFSIMLSRPQPKDTHPEAINLWTKYEDADGPTRNIPEHVMEWTRASDKRDYHYALVCHSHEPLTVGAHGAFDPARCETIHGKPPDGRMTTALLKGNPYEDHSPGVYHWGFRATLIAPWQVKLTAPRKLNSTDKLLFDKWKRSWVQFVAHTRLS